MTVDGTHTLTAREGLASRIVQFLMRHSSIVMLVALIAISAYLSDAFLSRGNIFNLLRQLTPLLLISIGMLVVINTGGIDLSVGAVAAAGGLAVAMLTPQLPFDGPIAVLTGVLIVLAFGGLLGAFNGALVAWCSLAPFVVTLAMMTIARGMTYMMSNGQPIRLPYESKSSAIFDSFGSGGVPGLMLPWPVLLSIVAIAFFWFLMHRTVFGRMVIATGSNETAVRLAGIAHRRYVFAVYVISGALSALAGVVVTSRTGVGTPITGIGFELDAIAACVIGGARLSGGRGTVINTLIGVLVLGLIGNIMNLMSIPSYPQQIIKGLIIIAAVMFQRFGRDAR
ncbi:MULTISPECIES: ABC transporter permease [Brucella]|uniref:ABC transporter permease n=1 Tax=Brucella lupini TaxID=255457 RepID=A0A256GHM7_9HYPH|nr:MULTISPECIES: ABC transporter permease [Brucella]KAB2702882.1 ABC transporter permease [Brucella lupini]KAB2728021.1 ABC transporter permease [Brucella anthropi]KAB2745193.1 ABC transporter permease [Brucella anthropi]KAB2800027.1 ABC transporter permease [Brucella anthropi]KAB2805618.1 ABC transporter permease [Brucella anthropi]